MIIMRFVSRSASQNSVPGGVYHHHAFHLTQYVAGLCASTCLPLIYDILNIRAESLEPIGFLAESLESIDRRQLIGATDRRHSARRLWAWLPRMHWPSKGKSLRKKVDRRQL